MAEEPFANDAMCKAVGRSTRRYLSPLTRLFTATPESNDLRCELKLWTRYADELRELKTLVARGFKFAFESVRSKNGCYPRSHRRLVHCSANKGPRRNRRVSSSQKSLGRLTRSQIHNFRHGLTSERLEERRVLTSDLLATLLPDAAGPQQWSEFGGAVAVSADYRVVGAPRAERDGLTDVGMVTVYDSTNQLLTTIAHPDPNNSDRFGYSLALSGATLVVGASRHDEEAIEAAGVAYVFNLASGTPEIPIFTLDNPSPENFDQFGHAVAIDGDTVVVSAYLEDIAAAQDAGNVYVYDLASGTPTLPVVNLPNPLPESGDRFGWSVALDGDTVVVGAFMDDVGAADSGTIYVFDLADPTPSIPIETISNPIPEPIDQFGGAVAVSGNLIAAGARVDDVGATNAGTVYIFDLLSGTPANPIHTIFNPQPGIGDQFGFALAIEGQTVVIGGWLDSNGGLGASGSTFVYDLGSMTPTSPSVTLQDPVPETNDQFGYAVDIHAGVIVVGARFNRNRLGASFVFDLADANPAVSIGTLANNTPASDDRFGYAIAASGDFLAVGVPLDENSAVDGGSVAVYDISSGTPSLLTTLLSPNPSDAEVFGSSVAISDEILVVGAFREDTGATDAGSAYVFDLSSGTPSVPIFTLNNPAPAADDLFAIVGSHRRQYRRGGSGR